jgi:MFS family permease
VSGDVRADTSLRAVFAGPRGRLLAALLLAEFAAAVQGIAYVTVLPFAARDLDGGRLYGATLGAGNLVTALVLALGAGLTARFRPRTTLAAATGLYVLGVTLAATAPAMPFLLAGAAVRGLAAGLLVALGMSAIGGLFEDALRPRVIGLFAIVWLLPSLAGPALNAAIAVAAGWRWAMAWPAVVVVVARILVGRYADRIPASTERRPVAVGTALVAVGGLLVASVASGSGRWGVPLLVVGLVAACGAGARLLVSAAAGSRLRARVLLCFAALGMAFFGGDGLVPLSVVEGLGHGVVASAVAVGSGLVCWSLTGLRPQPPGRSPDAGTVGVSLLTGALLVEALVQFDVLTRSAELPVVVAAWAVAGLGMGLAYGRLSAQAFDDLATEAVPPVAAAVAFAETGSAVVGSLLGGGVYSLGLGLGAPARGAIGVAFLLAAGAAATGTVLAVGRTTRRRVRLPSGGAARPPRRG